LDREENLTTSIDSLVAVLSVAMSRCVRESGMRRRSTNYWKRTKQEGDKALWRVCRLHRVPYICTRSSLSARYATC
jgi:hypothetical protein